MQNLDALALTLAAAEMSGAGIFKGHRPRQAPKSLAEMAGAAK
ncbi:MAG TPA: hypothetical protein QF564_24975 [Pirellulaceae bacterium]|nr:hypothetical protein [Pirellulaceae bacterium]